MKLYGAEISQQYIQYNDKKKRHIRYPNSISYPKEAAIQEKWGVNNNGFKNNWSLSADKYGRAIRT